MSDKPAVVCTSCNATFDADIITERIYNEVMERDSDQNMPPLTDAEEAILYSDPQSKTIDEKKWGKDVLGRRIIDYDKIKSVRPEIYKKLVLEQQALDDSQLLISIDTQYSHDIYSVLEYGSCPNCGEYETLRSN